VFEATKSKPLAHTAMATNTSTGPPSPLTAFVQQQVDQETRTRKDMRLFEYVLGGTVVALVLGFVAWYLFIRKPGANPTNPADCNPPCTGGQICVQGTCKANALSCRSTADCGACNDCDPATKLCTPRPHCCAGVTCQKGQQCNNKNGACEPVPGYCDASHPCPTGSACDESRNICVAQPPYGPNSGKGCIPGMGQWTWMKDENGNAGWECLCANPSLYSGANECSPLVTRTLCSATGVNSDALLPASHVGAYRLYGWGDQAVLINETTAGSALPSPIAGGQCPCKPGWGGGTCAQDQTCSGHGVWQNGQCYCYSCSSHYPSTSDPHYNYMWTGSDCSQLQCQGMLDAHPHPCTCSECTLTNGNYYCETNAPH